MLESHYYKDMVEAGCDEAGRGCLAGSVYAAAVILPPGYQNAELNDSKKLTDKKRKALRSTSRLSLETPEMPSRPDFLFRISSSSWPVMFRVYFR